MRTDDQMSAGDYNMPSGRDAIVYNTHFNFNAVYVLESLGPNDEKTGESLYDDVIFPQTRVLDGCYTKFLKIPDEAALLDALRAIRDNVRAANHRPIIHIEAHGDSTGIQLSDRNVVGWRQLAEPFAAINQESEFNLTVMAIACQGWYLTGALMPADRAPVALVIGPPTDMSGQQLLDASTRFYDTLFRRLDLTAALVAMNEGRLYDDWSLKPATAEILFCRVFRRYVDEVCSAPNLQERENRLVADVVRAEGLNLLQSAGVRLEVRRHIGDYEWWYNHFRERFMMLDIFPANRDRFGLTYSKCNPGALTEPEIPN